ncbi:MAG: ring-cleaving dioxygenase, partial [Lactobacillaceae bacterium]|nr:ring-cleaving dioxygenase [Lactobacillaceae bacterium]
MSNNIRGIHHLTTITSDSPKIWEFWTNIMGLHLIKKTVNQDDVRTYHLYFTDDMGDGGSVLTFFDFPGIQKAQFGTDEITRTSFRIANDSVFDYWRQRFDEKGIRYDTETYELFGSKYMNFYDFDDQRYALVSDQNNDHTNELTGPHKPWRFSDVPEENAILGLGPELLTVNDNKQMETILTLVMGAEKVATEGDYNLYEFDNGGHGAQVITYLSRLIPRGVQGFGGPHHLAFIVDDKDALEFWIKRLSDLGFQQSGYIDRFYFKSNYFRPTPGILFELATNGPGFLQDETYEEAGHHLELPPFLEAHRKDIEANLVPFNSGDD